MYWNPKKASSCAQVALININMRCIEICGCPMEDIRKELININMRCIEINGFQYKEGKEYGLI